VNMMELGRVSLTSNASRYVKKEQGRIHFFRESKGLFAFHLIEKRVLHSSEEAKNTCSRSNNQISNIVVLVHEHH
jgi:hypothetical protein